MSTVSLAQIDDLTGIAPMVAAFHAQAGIDSDEASREAALMPLLEGIPHGALYIIGPRRAPVGYIALSFGYSIEMGGIDGMIDELFIREPVRGRGLATEALLKLLPALSQNGVRALHLEVDRADEAAQRLCARAGFRLRDQYALMTRKA